MEREEQTKKPGESQTVVALFKMCTGTPHCGSGVQAADELLIPTSSSVLMFPFSTQPSPHSPPLISPPLLSPPSLPQLGCLRISQTSAEETKAAGPLADSRRGLQKPHSLDEGQR